MDNEPQRISNPHLPITETLMVSLRFMAENWVYLIAILLLAFVLMSGLLIAFDALSNVVGGQDPLSSVIFFTIAFLIASAFVLTGIAGPSLHGNWRYLLSGPYAFQEMRWSVGVWLWANVITFVACLPAAALGVALGGPALALPFIILVAIFLQVRFFLAIPGSIALRKVTLEKSWTMTAAVQWPTLALFALATIVSFVVSTFLSFPLALLERVPVGAFQELTQIGSTRAFFMNFAVTLCINTIIASNAFRWLDYYSDNPLLDYGE